jgi:chemotaxis protein methyltransferase CheR
MTLDVLGTDADEQVLRRAERGCYSRSSLKDVPADWAAACFEEHAGEYCIRPHVKRHVTFRTQDIRTAVPEGPFDVVLCRNLVFTYFDDSLQSELAHRIAARMRPGAVLVIGKHEQLPAGVETFEAIDAHSRVYRLRVPVNLP